MAGGIALVGSGEYLEVMQPLETMLLEAAVKAGRPAKYIQLATAAGRESSTSISYWQNLGAKAAARIGVEVVFVPIFNRSDAENPELARMIEDAGLIYMSGGDPQHLAKSLVGTPAGDVILQAWTNGAAVAGCSAGAMALGSSVPHALQFRRSETVGFGIAAGVHVLPHYDKYFGWAGDRVMRFVSQFDNADAVVGIDEETALYRLDAAWQVFGVGEVHTLSEKPVRRLRSGDVY